MLLATIACPLPLAAADAGLAGSYVCQSGCRVTDALPGIEIRGPGADCMNELGGVYNGRVLTARSVFCFNMVGTLSDNGETIQWSNGNVWRRWVASRTPAPR